MPVPRPRLARRALCEGGWTLVEESNRWSELAAAPWLQDL
jgi:hypothetical protein